MLIVSARVRLATNAKRALNIWYVGNRCFLHDQPARVRFAPSPTGQLHLGGLRTALFNYLLARKTGGQFILRIEDTDQTRYVEGATEKLVSALSWAGIKYDEGPNVGGPHEPYFQSQRTKIYQQHAEKLIEGGHAYRCFCTPERLEQVRSAARKAGKKIAYDKHCAHLSDQEIKDHLEAGTPYTVRLRTPEGVTSVDDNIHGRVTFSNNTLDDGILLKSDGYPTYHLANVVDDHMMGITHVLRGDEWLPSTPKHLILYRAFGWKPPQFYHLPLLLNPGGGKMSKRKGDAFVEHYIEQGYFPEAVNNFVALLGWSPENPDDEVLTSEELLAKFDVNGLNKSQAIVDMGKLGWLNKQHLLRRAETLEGRKEMAEYLRPLLENRFRESLQRTGKLDRLSVDYVQQVIDCVKERIRNIHDVPEFCQYFFIEPDYTCQEAVDMKKKLKKQATDLVFSKETIDDLQNVSSFDSQTINGYFNNLAKQSGASYNKILTAVRYGVTGKSIGASITHTMEVLGRETCIHRLQSAPL